MNPPPARRGDAAGGRTGETVRSAGGGFFQAAAIPLFACTIFLSAFLLFWIQPLFTKTVLPLLGGAPNVWNTALLFFQATLLVGYGYVHLATRRLSLRSQTLLHLGVLVAALAFLPPALAGASPPASGMPTAWLLGLLAASIGLPFMALSATSPLLQRWLSGTSHRAASDPYFLYAASNAGSVLALLAFPFLLEPWLGLARQRSLWSLFFVALLVLVGAVAGLAWKHTTVAAEPRTDSAPGRRDARAERAPRPAENPGPPAPSAPDRARWILLAFAPSSLLLGVTTHITTDLAAAPLFWVVPLALYLVTYILAFSRRAVGRRAAYELQPILVLLLAVTLGGQPPLSAALPLHLLTFFVVALVCHGELARRRPHPSHLTEFYVWIALGGALGGTFNALLAPLLFSSVLEYPLALALACTLRPTPHGERLAPDWRDVAVPAVLAVGGMAAAGAMAELSRWKWPLLVVLLSLVGAAVYGFRGRPVRFGLGVAALLLVAAVPFRSAFDLLESRRSFFGVYTVRLDPSGGFHLLFHGTTIHGAQAREPEGWDIPRMYYHPGGPLGDVMRHGPERREVGVVGLGVGSVACYAEEGQKWVFYEIDPLVERIARDTRHFHYLSECGGPAEVVIGDARLSLKAAPDDGFDLLIIDAFTSDAIPVHLMTREAVESYADKTREGGLIAFHISNRHMDLEPVLAGILAELGLAAALRHDAADARAERELHKSSTWVAASRSPESVEAIRRAESGWRDLRGKPGMRAWTDDYSNIVGVLKWNR